MSHTQKYFCQISVCTEHGVLERPGVDMDMDVDGLRREWESGWDLKQKANPQRALHTYKYKIPLL